MDGTQLGHDADENQIRQEHRSQADQEPQVACRLALHPEQTQDQLGNDNQRGESDRHNDDDAARQSPARFVTLVFPLVQKGGEERSRQCAFAEHAPGKIGDAERHGEGVHQWPVAENGRHADVAHKPQHAAQESQDTHRPQTGGHAAGRTGGLRRVASLRLRVGGVRSIGRLIGRAVRIGRD